MPFTPLPTVRTRFPYGPVTPAPHVIAVAPAVRWSADLRILRVRRCDPAGGWTDAPRRRDRVQRSGEDDAGRCARRAAGRTTRRAGLHLLGTELDRIGRFTGGRCDVPGADRRGDRRRRVGGGRQLLVGGGGRALAPRRHHGLARLPAAARLAPP